MPKVTDQLAERYVKMEDQGIEAGGVPIVDALVVYLGANKKKSVPLKGRILLETFGEGEDQETVRSAGLESGFTVYDFSTTDNRSRPIKTKLIPASFPLDHLRGRPFAKVEHPEHLWLFSQKHDGNGNPEFEVVPSAEHKRIIEEYFLRKLRARRGQATLLKQVVGGG